MAALFCAANVLWGLRDLATSDSAFRNRVYRGEATLMFVAIDGLLAAVFGFVAIRGLGAAGTRRKIARQSA